MTHAGRWVRWAAGLGCALAAGPGCATAIVNATFFHPAREVVAMPLPPGVEEHRISVGAGVAVRAYYRPVPGRDGLLVYFHGNAGHAAQRLPAVARLGAAGLPVLLVEYPGYGRSPGAPTEARCYATAHAALAYAERTLGVPKARTVVLGRSLGTAVAVEAVRDAPYAGLILVSPFTSGRDMAAALGFGWIGFILGHPFDSAAHIRDVRAPVFVLHGDADDLIPVEQGRELFALAPNPARLAIVPGAHHNDFEQVIGDAYWRWIAAFVDRCVGARAPNAGAATPRSGVPPAEMRGSSGR